MAVSLKKIGVKILLGLLEATKYLGFGLFWLGWLVSWPFRWFWKLVLRPLVYLAYRLFVRLRAVTGTMFEPIRKTVLAALGHRYVVHAMMAFIVLFVAGQNLWAHNADLESVGKNSLVYVYGQSADEISFAANDAAEASQFGLYGSASGTQPYFSTYDQSGVLRPFPVFPPEPGESRVIISAPEIYVVQPGDTLGGIARRYGLSLSTVLWANNLTLRSTIKIGQRLKILPTDGVIHVVKKGDTLASIAKKYKADQARILQANPVAAADQIRVGDELLIPGGIPPTPAPAPVIKSQPQPPGDAYRSPTEAPPSAIAGENLVWPTKSRRITQYFRSGHPGIDIGGPKGDPLYAVDDGVVTVAGWNKFGYGNMVLIDHGNGMITRYGHASVLYVKAGEQVQKGQVIALLGSTGRSTGPHLHFELYWKGVRRNPFQFYK